MSNFNVFEDFEKKLKEKSFSNNELNIQSEKIDYLFNIIDIIVKHSDHIAECYNRFQERVDMIAYENLKLMQVIREAYQEHVGRENFQDLFYDVDEFKEFQEFKKEKKEKFLNEKITNTELKNL